MDKFELNILGCGSATTSLRHMPTSQVLNIRDNLFMIDCGESAQLAMLRQRLKFVRLNHIFISHLHGDHCFGLPGLLSTLDLHGRTGPLTIHINADGAKHFGDFFDFFLKKCSYKIEFDVLGTSKAVIYEDDAITVTAVPLKHRVPTMGFVFAEKLKLRHVRGDMAKFYNVPVYMLGNLRRGEDFVTPDGQTIPNAVLTTGGTFPYENTTLEYSIRKDIEYTGEDQAVTVYWDVNETLSAGTYRADIFADGHNIGTTRLSID